MNESINEDAWYKIYRDIWVLINNHICSPQR